jgi:integrase
MNDLFVAHLRYLRHRGYSPDTVADRGKLLNRLERILPMGLERATVEELQDFQATPGFSLQTQATYYHHITGFFGWACHPSRVHLSYDPSAGLVRPKVPKGLPHPVSDAELVHALTNLREPWRTYVKLAAYEGMRAAEVATIDRYDITQTRTRIVGKGRKTRDLKTHATVWDSVQHFPAGRLARRIRDGREADPDYLSARCIDVLKRIDLPGVTLHRFRHWYGTMMLRPKEFGGAGASLRTVQLNMGHASPETTAIYTLVCDEERDAAIDALPTFDTPAPC